LKKELHNNKISGGKKLSEYFPFTLDNVKAGIPVPELPAGHAPPVSICQKTFAVSIMT